MPFNFEKLFQSNFFLECILFYSFIVSCSETFFQYHNIVNLFYQLEACVCAVEEPTGNLSPVIDREEDGYDIRYFSWSPSHTLLSNFVWMCENFAIITPMKDDQTMTGMFCWRHVVLSLPQPYQISLLTPYNKNKEPTSTVDNEIKGRKKLIFNSKSLGKFEWISNNSLDGSTFHSSWLFAANVFNYGWCLRGLN